MYPGVFECVAGVQHSSLQCQRPLLLLVLFLGGLGPPFQTRDAPHVRCALRWGVPG